MISKERIKKIRALHQKKQRELTQEMLVEGTKSCLEVWNSSLEIVSTYVTQDWIDKMDGKLPINIDYEIISQREMGQISALSTPPEVLSVVKIPQYNAAQFDSQQPILVLDAIRDPGNLGTIIRSADWFGIRQIFCSEDCVEFSNPKVIQATMGSFCRVKIVYGNIAELIQNQADRATYGMFLEGKPLREINFAKNSLVIVGNESEGISKKVEQLIEYKVHIPTGSGAAGAESLNASVATGILLYELSTQQH